MARLAKDLVKQREAFVVAFVAGLKTAHDGSGPTAEEINDALAAAFNDVRMRPQQVYKLKVKGMKSDPATITSAGRRPGKMPPKTIRIGGRNPGMQPEVLHGKAFTVPLDSEIGGKVLKMLAEEAGLDFEG